MARRDPRQNSAENVGRLIADEYSLLYEAPVERVARAALLRAEAARLRDEGAPRPDWEQVGSLLRESYRALLIGLNERYARVRIRVHMSTATATATATATMPVPLTFREVLANDVIRRVWFAQLVSLFGDFLALFAVISVVSFRMHGTATQLTWVQISYMFPLVILGPLAGVFVDRWPLKPTLVASDLIRAVLALFLDPDDDRLARVRRAGGAQLRVELLRPGANRHDPHAREGRRASSPRTR